MCQPSEEVPLCTVICFDNPPHWWMAEEQARLIRAGANFFALSPACPGVMVVRPALTQERVREAVGVEVECRIVRIDDPGLPLSAEYPCMP